MPDFTIYLIPIVIFVLLSVIVKVRSRGKGASASIDKLEPRARQRVERLLAEGRKIDAVVVVREATGASPTDVKLLVEQIDAQAIGD